MDAHASIDVVAPLKASLDDVGTDESRGAGHHNHGHFGHRIREKRHRTVTYGARDATIHCFDPARAARGRANCMGHGAPRSLITREYIFIVATRMIFEYGLECTHMSTRAL